MQTWTNTGDLLTAREGHTATLLPKGTVLVYGGETGIGAQYTPLSSAELYHPGTGQWTQTADAFYARHSHSATLLSNGRVLVAGGTTQTDTELYDPATEEWYATGKLNAARPSSHAATPLADGSVMVVGGYDESIPYPGCFLSSAEIYDPVRQVWALAGNLNYGRYGSTATLLSDGKVLVVGGGNSSIGFQNTAEVYDPSTRAWTLTGSLFYYRYGHTATRLLDGKVLVAGGLTYSPLPQPHDDSLDSAEIYDPATGEWYSVGKLSTARRYHTATFLPDGKVLVVGGLNRDLYSGGFHKLTSAELYDPATLTWTSAGDLHMPRASHTETLMHVGHGEILLDEARVLVAGGDDASSYSNSLTSAELYLTGPSQTHAVLSGK